MSYEHLPQVNGGHIIVTDIIHGNYSLNRILGYFEVWGLFLDVIKKLLRKKLSFK